MTSRKLWVLGLIASIFVVAGIGCASLSNLLTPATIDKQAVQYAAGAGVIDANDFRGYPNLDKAIRLKAAVDAAFRVKELSFTQMMQKNQLDYSQLVQVANANMEASKAREEMLFGEQGLLSMGLGLLGMGGLGAIVGLMRKRPGDITPQEMETALASVQGEVTTKDQQFLQLVKGVQSFLNAHKSGSADDPIAVELKAAMNGVQTVETRQAVASAKVAAV